MNQLNPFVISQFTNPSGEFVFRVAGWLDGKRIRKNFPARAEAEAERQILEVQRLQGDAGIHTTVTRLGRTTEITFRQLFSLPSISGRLGASEFLPEVQCG